MSKYDVRTTQTHLCCHISFWIGQSENDFKHETECSFRELRWWTACISPQLGRKWAQHKNGKDDYNYHIYAPVSFFYICQCTVLMTITFICCKWDMWEKRISMMEWFCSQWLQIIYIFSSRRANAWLVLHCSTGLTTSGRIRPYLQPTEGCLGTAASPRWHILMFYSQKVCRVSQHGGGDTRRQAATPREGEIEGAEGGPKQK